MNNKTVQLIFGLPILAFAIVAILLDSASLIDVGKFGYAFFGSIITTFLSYYFRKKTPADELPSTTEAVPPVGFHVK